MTSSYKTSIYPPKNTIQYAVDMANNSPCEKSKRGVVIFSGKKILGSGFNAPSAPLTCLKNENCRPICNKICVHAEIDAILEATKNSAFMLDCDMLHIKTVEGKPTPGGPPSCWQCSRHVVNSGIKGVYLLHEEGWSYYPSIQFHELTLRNCGLIL